ncbi:IRF8 [Branchiostoma lanceolatum]|uniref:IRF8 protein n=1 Tax=Branchiostoma lanceolatum TaxID=7740 RepID=A0A8K0EXS8_BRALA|nr:IRF8 [Branchiostoma lanceolatum]
MAHSADDRKRLRNFFISHLDAEDVPGVQWIDRTTGLFRIVWRHAGRDGFDPERDGLIFKLWAQQTGRWKEGDPEDTTAWKTRMRNALRRLADFEEQTELGKPDDPHEAFRVYRLVPAPKHPPKPPMMPETCMVPDELMSDLGDTKSMNCLAVDEVLDYFDGLDADMVSPAPPDDPSQSACAQLQPIAANGAPQPNVNQAADGATATASDQTRGPFPNLPDGDVKVSVKYRGRQVWEETCSNPSGVRIYHGSPIKEYVGRSVITDRDPERVFGPDEVTHVLLPPCEPHMHSQKQLDVTKELLKHAERGVVLQFSNGDIWATRLCQTKVFWMDPNKPDMAIPLKLERDTRTKVFDYIQGFLPLLQNYARNNGSKKPRPYFKMCFGQSWGAEDPFESNLIAVTVKHLTAGMQLDTVSQYRHQDSTSSQSFPLNNDPLSRSNPEDHIIQQLEQLMTSLTLQQGSSPPQNFQTS